MTDLTALSYWYPIIRDAGIPVPETKIIHMPTPARDAIFAAFDGKEAGDTAPFFAAINTVASKMGYPVFLRTDHTSAKHNWKDSCFLTCKEDIPKHVMSIVEYSEMAMGLFGPPWDMWSVREFLPTIPYGVCKNFGNMPVCKEFRFFVVDGEVLCRHPYWIGGSVLQGFGIVERPWVSRVVQGPVFVKELISAREGVLADGPEFRGDGLSPSGSNRYPLFAHGITMCDDLFVKLHQDFGLSLLDAEMREKNATCLGGFRCGDAPVEQGLPVSQTGRDDARLRAAEGFMENIDGAALDLLDLDLARKIGAAVGTAGRGLLEVDRETAVRVKDAGAVSNNSWVVFHELHDASDEGYSQVIMTILPDGWLPPDVRLIYDKLCDLDENEANLLSDLAQRAGSAVGGAWSIDILETTRGWMVTDMAEAHKSFHWEDCPNQFLPPVL